MPTFPSSMKLTEFRPSWDIVSTGYSPRFFGLSAVEPSCSGDQNPYAGGGQGQGQSAENPDALESNGKKSPELCARHDTNPQSQGSVQPVEKNSVEKVHGRASQGHEGKDEVRSSGRHMHGEEQKMHQHRHVDDAPSDSQETRNESDQDAQTDADKWIESIAVGGTVAIREQVCYTRGPSGTASLRTLLWENLQEHCAGDHPAIRQSQLCPVVEDA